MDFPYSLNKKEQDGMEDHSIFINFVPYLKLNQVIHLKLNKLSLEIEEF